MERTLIFSVQITTGYNLEDDRCECVALQDYKENQQVRVSVYSVSPPPSAPLPPSPEFASGLQRP